ncbi:MAG: NAD-dependent epimerase/dehydratase family protein [Acidobacteria bacterium]|nr:MAG: NAD-dependent epimerase/dehydratase family protein [Acidobacteriota bacterium]MCL4287692.1 NAD-dependent epimerase/dehydratase family protein [Thermoleophilia bacterium]
MATTLVTGATGLLGSHLVRALAARGDELRLLVRRDSDTGSLEGVEYEGVTGDITDRRAVRRAVKGADRVFHLAARSTLRSSRDSERVFEVNVGGTGLIAAEALAAGVERFVHTSSVVAIGPAPTGGRADETHPFTVGHLGIAYINSKHEAEAEVLRAAARGLDAVIVNPAFTLGPPLGPTRSMSVGLVRRFLQRRIPAYVDGGLNVVDVRDVATAQLSADERGRRGERYILGGRNFTTQRLFADLARISGAPVPPLRLTPWLAAGGAQAIEAIGLDVGLSVDQVRAASLWWTCSSAKAKRELDFAPRPHEETLEATVAALAEEVAGAGPADAALGIAGQLGGIARRLWPR